MHHGLALTLALAGICAALFVLSQNPNIVPENAGPVVPSVVETSSTPTISTNNATSVTTATPAPVVPGAEVTPGREVAVLRLHQRVPYNTILIEPVSVVEDSRCPSDVQCVWAGRAVIQFAIYSLEGELIQSYDLEEGTFFYPGSTKITLEGVRPQPVSTMRIEDTEYRFDVLFEVLE